MIRRLRDLIAPLSEREFLDSFSKKHRLVVKTAQPERTISLLPWSTINYLIGGNVMPASQVVLELKGTPLLDLMYRHGEQRRVHPDALMQLAEQGVSIVLDEIDGFVPAIAILGESIERRIGQTVWVNCYITFGTTSAFKPHCDSHDVLAVQIHGAKRWRVYDNPKGNPATRLNKVADIPDGNPVWEQILEPGDILYMPRGEMHDTVGVVKPSVHLTIGILAPNGIDLLNWMAERTGNSALKMDIARVGKGALHIYERDLKQQLHELIDQISFDAFLDEADQQCPLASRLNLNPNRILKPDTWLAPTPKRRIALAPDSTCEAEVTVGGRLIRLSADARRVLHLLLEEDGLPFSAVAQQLDPPIKDDDLRTAIARLVSKRLVIADTPLE